MTEYIIQKLLECYPQIATYFIIILVVAYTVYKVTIFYKDTKDKNNKFGEEFKSVNGTLVKVNETLTEVDKGLAILNQALLEKNVISISCYSNKNSPRVINQLGLKLYSESGAEKLFNSIKDELLLDLEKKQFDSLLELEMSSLNVLMEKMSDSRFKDVQNFIFEHPNFEDHPLTYTDILFVMSLKLRETYREKHKDSGLE